MHLQTKAKLKMHPLVTALIGLPERELRAVKTFLSLDETLVCDHSYESY